MNPVVNGHWVAYIGKSVLYIYYVPFLLGILAGCSSAKTHKNDSFNSNHGEITEADVDKENGDKGISGDGYGVDSHFEIRVKPLTEISNFDEEADVSIQKDSNDEVKVVLSPESVIDTSELTTNSEVISRVADKIVENYIDAKNKEPEGHCLVISKRRFMKAYKDIYGHSVYDDLPNYMATKYYSSREVFDNLYVSASGVHRGWRSLPIKYRGKGNAGAIAYAGMGTLVGRDGIWSGELRPGAPMQVWRFKDDYEDVVKGVDKKNFDPYGHSFIFIGYLRNEKNEIIGIRIADQGFQSYRPLLPRDYEVWWAVNLTV